MLRCRPLNLTSKGPQPCQMLKGATTVYPVAVSDRGTVPCFGLRTSSIHGAPPDASQTASRVIRVGMLDLRGRGAAFRRTHLVGVSRESMRTYPEPGDQPRPNWDFVTDRKGYFRSF
jgi:hypothetical protein